MIETNQRCVARTQDGDQCIEFAVQGEYCSMHATPDSQSVTRLKRTRDSGASKLSASSDADSLADYTVSVDESSEIPPFKGLAKQSGSKTDSPEIAILLSEIDGLFRELRALVPDIRADEINPAVLVHLFNKSVGSRIPAQQAEFFTDLESNLEGSSFSDFTDPDVLRGFATLTYYSIQIQAEAVRGPVNTAIDRWPAITSILTLRQDLSKLTVHDWLEPKNWFDAWQVVSYGALLKTLEIFSEDEPKS